MHKMINDFLSKISYPSIKNMGIVKFIKFGLFEVFKSNITEFILLLFRQNTLRIVGLLIDALRYKKGDI